MSKGLVFTLVLLSLGFLGRALGQTSGGSLAGTGLQPAEIARQLDAAKAAHRQAIDDAKKALLHTIDERIDAATDAGNLSLVTSLQAVRATAAVDATVPDDVKDSAVLAARRSYETSIKSADTRLNLAYQKAVRDYTRARQIALAQSTQDELNSLELVDPTAPSAITTGTYQLARFLPDFLTAKDSFFVPLGDRLGIVVPEHQYIRTRESDLLTKNFTADFWFYMIRGMRDYPKLPSALIGFGEGTANPVNGGPLDSIYLEINPPDQNRGEVNLHRRLTSTKTTIGHLKEFDTYVARIQKSGDEVSFIIGTEQNGTLVPEISVSVDDIRADSPYLNESNTHLFFGSGAFQKLSIGKGPAPVRAEAGSRPLAVAGDKGAAPVVTPPVSTAENGNSTGEAKPKSGGRNVDLLKLVDVNADSVAGSWKIRGDATSPQLTGADGRLEIPYAPPEEYDYRIMFKRTNGNDMVSMVFSAGGHQMLWMMGGAGNSICGFEMIGANGASNNSTTVRSDRWLLNGRLYTCVLKIRKGGIEAYLDDKLIASRKTDYSDMYLWQSYELPATNAIGLVVQGTSSESATFECVQLTEITGTGRVLTQSDNLKSKD